MQQAKHNPITFYMRVLLYAFIGLLLRVVALLPLAALWTFPSGSPWRYTAILCPVLIVFGIMPLRYSFADALVQPSRRRYFSYDRALGFSHYWEKLLESLLHALNVLKWGIPLMAMGVYALYVKDNVDARTLITTLGDMGRTAGNIWYATINFFITLFGGQAIRPVAASMVQGLYVVGGIVGLGVLVLAFGAMRNSCSRYIWVIASRADRPVRTEIRRRMRGRRWRQFLVSLCNLVLLAPFLVVVAFSLKDVLGESFTALMMMVGYNGGSVFNVTEALMPIVAAFVLLYMPLLPARRIITAAFASHTPRHTAPQKPANKPVATEPVTHDLQEPEAMPAAIVPDWVRQENEANYANEASKNSGIAAEAPQEEAAQPIDPDFDRAVSAFDAAAFATQPEQTAQQAPDTDAVQAAEATESADAPMDGGATLGA